MYSITIVVCTRNRAESLASALNSLISLKTGNLFTYEILVVNNNSIDETSKVVWDLAASSPIVIREYVEQQAGIVYARNSGVREALGDWIAFFDDDQLADQKWLWELMRSAEHYKVRCVGGAVTLKLPCGHVGPLSPICRMLLGETVGMVRPQFYTSRQTPGAGNMLLHRSVFSEVGLFDERYNKRGEDTDLFLRMLAAYIEAWYTPDAIVHHVISPDRLSPDYLLRLSNIMSEGMALSERDAVGKRLYPLYWCARLGQMACVIFPRFLWSLLLKNRESQLGLKCRLRVSQGYLKEGFSLLFS